MTHLHDWETVSEEPTFLADSGTHTFDIDSPEGKVVVSGSVKTSTATYGGFTLVDSFPLSDTTWRFVFWGSDIIDNNGIFLYVVCATT